MSVTSFSAGSSRASLAWVYIVGMKANVRIAVVQIHLGSWASYALRTAQVKVMRSAAAREATSTIHCARSASTRETLSIGSANTQADSCSSRHLADLQRFPTEQPRGLPRLARGLELPAGSEGREGAGPQASQGCRFHPGRIGNNQPRQRRQLGGVVQLRREGRRTSQAVTR